MIISCVYDTAKYDAFIIQYFEGYGGIELVVLIPCKVSTHSYAYIKVNGIMADFRKHISMY